MPGRTPLLAGMAENSVALNSGAGGNIVYCVKSSKWSIVRSIRSQLFPGAFVIDFTFDPAARTHIDRKATALVAKVARYQIEDRKDVFESARQPSANITKADILKEFIITETDFAGRPTGMRVPHESTEIGLQGESFGDLHKLVMELKKTTWVAQMLTDKYLQEHVFDYCITTHISRAETSLADSLTSAAETDIATYRIHVPLYGVEIEEPFNLGPFHYELITPTVIDTLMSGRPSSDKKEDTIDRLKQRYSGHTAVVTVVRAEINKAMEVATDQADFAVSLLRLFSLAMFFPEVICAAEILGSEHMPAVHALIADESGLLLYRKQKLLSLLGAEHWQIPKAELERIRASSIGKCIPSLFPNPVSQFAEYVRTALLTYSRGLATRNLSDRLAFSVTALELLLHRDDREDIQQNIAERIAFMVAKDGATRRAVIKNFKEMYAMRSRYVHHGVPLKDRGELSNFLKNAWAAISSACNCVQVCKTKNDFLNMIDEIKYGPGQPAKT